MARYHDKFFRNRHDRTVYAAETVLDLLLPVLPPLRSAVDIGCGVGTWLSVLSQRGISEIQGVDGHWVDTANLAIPPESFSHHDLQRDLDLGRRFDLAISLEVAEHLPAERASGFVSWLTGLADIVLFSAATPRQGGRNHFNEQWQEYWAALFARHGYVTVDFIRCAHLARSEDRDVVPPEHARLCPSPTHGRMPFSEQPPALFQWFHPEVFLSKLDRAATFGGAVKH